MNKLLKSLDKWSYFYSSGCLLYEIVAGRIPFKALNKKAMIDKILEVDYVMPENFSDNLKDLVQKIIVGMICELKLTLIILGLNIMFPIFPQQSAVCTFW